VASHALFRSVDYEGAWSLCLLNAIEPTPQRLRQIGMQAQMPDHNVIEIFSDVVCPWCFVGKRRAERALSLVTRGDIQLRWRAFDLHPGTPKEGVGWEEHMVRKFGSSAYARRLEANVAAAAREDGITLRFDKIQRLPNTLDAHRLIWFSSSHGLQVQVVDAVYIAYFCDGRDVGNRQELIQIATEAGLDEKEVSAFLAGVEGTDEVISEQHSAYALGIQGVPSFLLNGQLLTSGAQAPETLARLIDGGL
jgi:predicted DsbA family dithiol-disulfide isomerase